MKRVAAALFALATAAHAGEASVLPCRPTIACTAHIEAAGLLTLEAGYLLRKLDKDVTQRSMPFLFKLSFNDWLQGQLGSNGPTFADGSPSARFHDDVEAGVKARLLERDSTAISVSATLSAPLPAQAGYLRTWDALFVGYFSQSLPLGLSADLNLGLDLWRIEGSAIAQPWAALALNHELPAGFSGMAEVYGFAGAQPVSSRDAGVLVALSYSVASWLVLDAGADLGLVSERSLSVFAGLTLSPTRP
jgi:hypothetical protein